MAPHDMTSGLVCGVGERKSMTDISRVRRINSGIMVQEKDGKGFTEFPQE